MLLPLLSSAFFTGLAGSAHCVGMCGGIGSSLGIGTQRTSHTLLYQSGRLLSYTLLGLILGSIFPLLGIHPSLPSWGIWLRRLTAILIAFIGIRQFFHTTPLRWLEKYGRYLWQPIARMTRAFLPVRTGSDAFLLGILWGLLPCGLIYSALGVAISTANPLFAAAVMLTFGLGTLPAMLGITFFSQQFNQWLTKASFRSILGLLLILTAFWTWH
ncbi:sulfite exporter TauE/SafE family protein [Suttonella ornithocola]|uniref:Uncharacterized conserved protein n=1 Tax=Suttonella ornithocola TaxID=279832 RepID=A0A380MNV9_9GAMM|nr:sulfite exporter TauE/SafE family protein [Suttonella ornithocola]SUO94002.1 Uncharacterized conserved protein [Suttonella ornithocola]